MAENRGAIRSKKLLTQAFFDLLKENKNRRIQIKELCSRAGVARPTFYAHYLTIEDIPTKYYCDHFLKAFSDQLESHLEKKGQQMKHLCSLLNGFLNIGVINWIDIYL